MFDKPMRYLLLACLLFCTSPVRADLPPLSFGVFPNLSARQVVEIYRPLAQALEKHLKREVVIYSARDFRTFAQRTARSWPCKYVAAAKDSTSEPLAWCSAT